MPKFKFLSKKPTLEEPEVIELGLPGDQNDPSTSSNIGLGQSDDPVTNAAEENDPRVFDSHIAVLYDRYLNFKESLSNRIRDKIMAFMQDDLQEGGDEGDLDIEGGLATRQPDSTYDALVLFLTIVLGFVFRFPLMWLLGSFLFLIYGNFKRKTVKWGLINIALSILSIVYAAQMWDYTDPEMFMFKSSRRSVLLSKNPHVKGVPGVLTNDGKDVLSITLNGSKDMKWSIIHTSWIHGLKHSNFSDKLLVNSKLIPDKTDMIKLNHEITMKGLVQISVKFKTDNLTPLKHSPRPNSHHYPLHHKPTQDHYDLSFECVPADPKQPIEEDKDFVTPDHTLNFDHPGDGLTTSGDDQCYPEDLLEEIRSSSQSDTGSDENPENLPVFVPGESHDMEVNPEEQPDSESETKSEERSETKLDEKTETKPEEKAAEKTGEHVGQPEKKSYIGVDAVDSDVFVTRIFNMRNLSKCCLVYFPKMGLDVVSVEVKRLQ